MTRVLREVGLTVAAVLGVVVLVGGVAVAGVRVRALVFRSGSMAPTIDTGGLGISHVEPAARIERGDIVTVNASSGVRVTHRVVGIAPAGSGRVALTLKGDANPVADSETYVVSEAPVLAFGVPKAGYVLGWLAGPTGLPLLGVYGAVMGYLMLRRTRPESGARW